MEEIKITAISCQKCGGALKEVSGTTKCGYCGTLNVITQDKMVESVTPVVMPASVANSRGFNNNGIGVYSAPKINTCSGYK